MGSSLDISFAPCDRLLHAQMSNRPETTTMFTFKITIVGRDGTVRERTCKAKTIEQAQERFAFLAGHVGSITVERS